MTLQTALRYFQFTNTQNSQFHVITPLKKLTQCYHYKLTEPLVDINEHKIKYQTNLSNVRV